MPEAQPRPSDEAPRSNDELSELTTSQAKHINIPLQRLNRDKQQTNRYGTVSDNPGHVNSDALKPQLKLQVDDDEVDNNKN